MAKQSRSHQRSIQQHRGEGHPEQWCQTDQLDSNYSQNAQRQAQQHYAEQLQHELQLASLGQREYAIQLERRYIEAELSTAQPKVLQLQLQQEIEEAECFAARFGAAYEEELRRAAAAESQAVLAGSGLISPIVLPNSRRRSRQQAAFKPRTFLSPVDGGIDTVPEPSTSMGDFNSYTPSGSPPRAPYFPPQRSSSRSPKPSEAIFSPQHTVGIIPVLECVRTPTILALYWFTHIAAPSFTICTRCYADYIHHSSFRDSFKFVRPQDGTARKCYFGSSRVKDGLWPAAVASQSLGMVVDFMQQRQKLGPCPAPASKGRSWYISSDIPGLSICPACFEDEVLISSFGSRFRLEVIDRARSCDLSTCDVKRAFEALCRSKNWGAFVSSVRGGPRNP